MRTPWIAGIALVAAGVVAQAAITPEQTARLKNATAVVNAMRQAGTSPQIPEDVWNRANCVLVLPSVKKAAFIFGGEYGKGVVSCRREKAWSPPAFMELEKGSWGFQAGAEEVDLVLLMMNQEGMHKLLEDKVTLGAGASIAAGPVGRTARAETDAQMNAQILSVLAVERGVRGREPGRRRTASGRRREPRRLRTDGRYPGHPERRVERDPTVRGRVIRDRAPGRQRRHERSIAGSIPGRQG